MATLKQTYLTDEEENLGKQDAIVAFSGGGQTSAVLLTKKWSEVIPAADYDSVKIPSAKIGAKWVAFNNSDFILAVFPTLSESINGIDDYQFNIAARSVMVFESQKDGKLFAYGNSIQLKIINTFTL